MLGVIIKIRHSSEEKILKEIKNVLNSAGIKREFKGYRMWITAAMYVISKANLGYGEFEMREVYNFVSKKYKCTYIATERTMKYTLNDADEENLKKFFKISYKITNSRFLLLLVDTIADNLNNCEIVN